MAGLTDKDIEILGFYAKEKNRELYWNYLAQTPGNDGYGLLALGVVRNDNVPGQVANHHAATFAGRSAIPMTERSWEQLGIDLMQRDFAARQEAFSDKRAQEALNLPADKVTHVHDRAFEKAGIDKYAWTPRRLMEMAENNGGKRAMDDVWSGMLDNQKLGLYRGTFTTREVGAHTDLASLDSMRTSFGYLRDMGEARATAHFARSNTNPDIIGTQMHYYRFDRGNGTWTETHERVDGGIEMMPSIRRVTDPKELERLNDTRELRLQRQELREQFHPDDPYRGVARSPQTLAQADRADGHGITPSAWQSAEHATELDHKQARQAAQQAQQAQQQAEQQSVALQRG